LCRITLQLRRGAAGSGFQTTNMRRFLTVLTVVMLAAAAAGPVAASDDAAEKSLAIGVDTYRQGSLEAAIEALSEALQGTLSSRQAAKALYYRGLAYRALGKPGQAIADLDAAIALRNGLSLGQLAHAEDNRAAAYQEAGLTAGETVVPATPGETVVPARAAKMPQLLPAHEQQAQSFLTTTSIDQAAPGIPAWGAAATAPAKLEKGPRISSAREPQSRSFLTTTSIASTEPAISAWGAATTAPSIPQRASTAFAPAVLQADVQGSAAASGIRVQVARVQTPSEAYTVAVRLVSQHGAEFPPSMLKIVPALTANKEKVYLVRLGPFADADQAQKRCSSLRKTGFDCVVQYPTAVAAQSPP